MKLKLKLTGKGGKCSGLSLDWPPAPRWKLSYRLDTPEPMYWFEHSDGHTLRWWMLCTENG